MSLSNDNIDIRGLRDVSTPLDAFLSGIYKKSFAYATLKDRLPVILTGVINTMSRDKDEIIRKFGTESSEELKHVIGELNKLRSELMTNKSLTLLQLGNNEADGDAAVWNDCLKERTATEGSPLRWFNTAWLLSECYMYRRINQALVLTRTLKTYDPFEKQKQNAFEHSSSSIKALAAHTMSLLRRTDNVSTAERKHEFIKLLKLNLWGNRCDLSLSGGAESNSTGNPIELLDSFESDLLIDDTRIVWDLLNNSVKTGSIMRIVDIVLDNAGYELFTDLCVANFLIAHELADKVRFYVKRIPWYVSDVNAHDFHWTIDRMINSEDVDLKALGDTCARNLKTNRWTIEIESFWTEPYDFSKMNAKAPALYGKLAESVLIVLKGDLNYRKLLGDRNWDYATSLEAILKSTNFRPTSLVTMRTLKSDLCAGLSVEKVDELRGKNENWMITGQYGVIHSTRDIPSV